MKLTDRLIQLMDEKGINRAELAKGTGIPYTTIVSLFDKGADNIKLSTMRKLTEYFGITLDDLVDGDSDNLKNEMSTDEILTLAAHQVGHEGALTEEQLAQVKLAMKIALAKNDK